MNKQQIVPVFQSLILATVAQAATLVSGIILARALGVEARGQVVVLLAYATLAVGVSNLGSADTIAVATLGGVSLPRIHSALKVPLTCALMASAFALGGFASLGITGIGVVCVVALLVYLPLANATALVGGYLIGLSAIKANQIVRIVSASSISVLLGVLWLSRGSLTATLAIVCYASAEVVTLGVALFIVRYQRRDNLDQEGLHTIWTRSRLVSFGLRAQPVTLMGLLNDRGDQLLLALLIEPHDIAKYAVAVSAASPVALIVVALAPVILRDATNNKSDHRTMRLAMILALVTAFCLSFLDPDLVPLVFGDRYKSAVSLARVMDFVTVLLVLQRALGAHLRGLGMPGRASFGEALAVAGTFGCLSVSVSSFGVVGAAVSSGIGYTIGSGYGLLTIRSLRLREMVT